MLAEKHERDLLDLPRLTYISSVGLRSLLKVVKHTAQCSSRTGISSVPPQVLELIQISGLQALLDIYPDQESAFNGRQP